MGTETYGVVAHELPPSERGALYPRIVGAVPVFGEYQAKTDRSFPVFELVRTIDHGSGDTDV